jgi:V/A-type H+-transporting ATPase subunit I
MWLPESMTHLLFATRREKLKEKIQYIGDKGEFHLTKVEDENLKQPRTGEKINKLSQQKNKIEKIIGYFGIEPEPIEAVAVKPEEVEKEAKNFVERFNRELNKREEQKKKLEKEEFELDIVAELLSLLPDMDFDIRNLFEGQYFNLAGGTIPVDEKESLQDVKDVEEVFIFHSTSIGDAIPVIIFYPGQEEERFKRVSNRISFSRLDRFDDFKGPINDCKESVEIEFWEINEKRTQLKSDILDMGEDGRQNLLRLNKRLETAIKELRWIQRMGQTKNVYFINTYIPTSSARKIKKDIENDENLYIIEEKKVRRNSSEAEETPVRLSNPEFISPFESLITTYGVPSYKGIDPTIPTMLTFLVMFGIMFADIGHGLVLFLGGGALWFFSFLRRFSYYLLYMGIAAMIFGILFGEFFGTNLLDPVWFSPFDNTENALLLGLYFGIFMVSTGFFLRMIENLVNRDYEGLLLSAEGLPGFVFYVSIILILYSIMQGGAGNLIYSVAAVTVLSLLVIAFGRPVKEALTTGLQSDTLLESLVEILHISIAVISNTLSYIRVAAFNIGHVILTLSILRISQTLGGESAGGRISMLILGNLGIILLEGLIVFIQTLRLEYYEFFSRFFMAGEKAYKPVKIK